MKNTILALILCVYILSSCSTGGKHINSKLNKEYLDTVKTFKGNLNPTDLKQVREQLEKELNTRLYPKKAIVINYYQYAQNCFEMRYPKDTRKNIVNNSVNLSASISLQENAQDFFVYTKDAIDYHELSKRENFIIDSNFFHDEIFTLHENCRAFFIIKPNGDFTKHYGSDYYTHVQHSLQSK